MKFPDANIWSAIFAGLALLVSGISYHGTKKSNKHNERLDVAKLTYFKILTQDIPLKFSEVKTDKNGKLDQNSVIPFLKIMDVLQEKIVHLRITNKKLYNKINSKIDRIGTTTQHLAMNSNVNLKSSDDWNDLEHDIKYIYSKLIDKI